MRIVPYSAVQFGSYNIYKKVCAAFLFFCGGVLDCWGFWGAGYLSG
jgi:hypothetical protein